VSDRPRFEVGDLVVLMMGAREAEILTVLEDGYLVLVLAKVGTLDQMETVQEAGVTRERTGIAKTHREVVERLQVRVDEVARTNVALEEQRRDPSKSRPLRPNPKKDD